MAFFLPTAARDKATDITPELLRAMGVKYLLLDVDNTLANHGSQTPFKGSVEWTRRLSGQGFQIVIVSNNFEKRVAPFAAQYGLPCVHFAMKPLPFGFRRAARRMGAKRSETVVIGDQIFTDIVGANLSRMKSILLVPREKEDTFSFRVRRRLEQPLRRRFEKSGRGEAFAQIPKE